MRKFIWGVVIGGVSVVATIVPLTLSDGHPAPVDHIPGQHLTGCVLADPNLATSGYNCTVETGVSW